MTAQQQLKEKLEQAGIPFRDIECYGRQIVVTSQCVETANKWARLLAQFAKVRGVIRSVDYVGPKVTRRKTIDVWRTFAAVL